MNIVQKAIGKVFGANGLVIRSLHLLDYPLCKPIPYEYRPGNLYYALICRLYYRHNVIKVNALGSQWNEYDSLILEAVFQVFVEFMETEEPFRIIKTDATDESHKIWTRLEQIYKWVKFERHDIARAIENDHDIISQTYVNQSGGVFDWNNNTPEYKSYVDSVVAITNRETALYEKETQIAMEILEWRAYLWV